MAKKWKYLGSAAENVFGTIQKAGYHWLEDPKGFRHLASPIGSAKTGKNIGWDIGKYGSLKNSQVKKFL